MSSGVPKFSGPSVADLTLIEQQPSEVRAAFARYYAEETDAAYSRGWQDGWEDCEVARGTPRRTMRVTREVSRAR